jgi:citrate lyase subunit beta/citryl-CoA lyase
MRIRTKRSLLYIPADSERMIEKTYDLQCDAVIFDLEDAVELSRKEIARENVIRFLSDERTKKGISKEVIVRINSLDTFIGITDLYQLLNYGVDTYLIPKASPESVVLADAIIGAYEKSMSLKPNDIGIIALIETALGILEIGMIACAAKRITGLQLGAEDLTKDLCIHRSANGEELQYARNAIVFAARANQIDAIDTPFTNYRDVVAMDRETRLIKAMGMTAKTAIHPNQTEIINRIFSPSKEEIEEALAVVTTYQKALSEGKGAVGLNGKMIDAPIAARAQKILELAKEYGMA